jgi:hypothetical protein
MRILSGKTRKMIAEETGFNYNSIARWEVGCGNPTVDKLPILAKACSCDVSDLLEPYEKK